MVLLLVNVDLVATFQSCDLELPALRVPLETYLIQYRDRLDKGKRKWESGKSDFPPMLYMYIIRPYTKVLLET